MMNTTSRSQLASATSSLRFALFGDSTMMEFATALRLRGGFNCSSDQMRVFRLNFLPAVPLLQVLRSILLDSRLDVVVMSMGVWYNWDPAETIPAQPSLTRVANTSMCEGEVLSDQERRACGRNGLNDYVADLRRLHGAVAQLRQESDKSSFPVHSLSRKVASCSLSKIGLN